MPRRDKGRIEGRFVPLRFEIKDCAAWRAMSPGARCLYLELRSRVPNDRNQAFLSQRDAAEALGQARPSVRRWFEELQHYGFIVMEHPGCLGSDGKGKAPKWRLTEKGNTSKASATGELEWPTKDYLKWDGARYRRNRIPGPRVYQGGPPCVPGPGPRVYQGSRKVGPRVSHMAGDGWAPVLAISSKPSRAARVGSSARSNGGGELCRRNETVGGSSASELATPSGSSNRPRPTGNGSGSTTPNTMDPASIPSSDAGDGS
jgi:hypothetical protein